MKYMILLHASQQDFDAMAGRPTGKPPMSPEQVAAMHAHMEALHKDLADSGELVDAQGLTTPVHARRVQVRKGAPVVTDGPYAETQEVLAGFTIIDCESLDRALQIAARFVDPNTDGDYVDVRPIIRDVSELEL